MTAPVLTPEQSREALRRIAAWRSQPDAPVQCPSCEARRLIVVDRSARPYAEWYALSCTACGLDTTLQVPMAPPSMD